jgi:hypothetical protein
MKTLFTLTLVFAGLVFITHKGWHKPIFMFLDANQGKATELVEKTKDVAHDLTKTDTVIVIQK